MLILICFRGVVLATTIWRHRLASACVGLGGSSPLASEGVGSLYWRVGLEEPRLNLLLISIAPLGTDEKIFHLGRDLSV